MTTTQSADHVFGRRVTRWLSAIVLCTTLGCQKDGAAPAPQTPDDTLGEKERPEPGEPTSQNPSTNAQVASNEDTVEVTLCDGKTKTTVAQGTPATAIAGNLMSEWIRRNPNRNWEADERERHKLQPAADNKELVGMDQGQTYGEVTEQTAALWKEEAERVALAGSGVFHSGDELGSTIGVSCDMCHPHAANTHPETYPKFQVQLGRVALLRDMINWCIQHPVRGQPLAADDPKMRALEAYILAQRKGKALEYGKH
jgi:thiosulfate dehydrogenase